MVSEGFKESKDAAVAGVRRDVEVSLVRLKEAGVSVEEAAGILNGAMQTEYGKTVTQAAEGKASDFRGRTGTPVGAGGYSGGRGNTY